MGVNEGEADVYCTLILGLKICSCNVTRGGRQRWLIIAATSQYELESKVAGGGLHSSFSFLISGAFSGEEKGKKT